MSGVLMLVATPIGNLGDLSPRAVEVLTSAETIYCEDTRHSRKLISHAGILGATLRSLHEHNEAERIAEVIEAVGRGATVALVTDAGMPGISDPGARVAAAVAAEGLVVSVVPGPSAVLAALVVSGLPTDRFSFDGFLPRSGSERADRLAQLARSERTTVLFEAPGRVAATLRDIVQACGPDRAVSISRELTKLFEETWRGTAADGAAWAAERDLKGEVVVVVGARRQDEAEEISDDEVVAALAPRLAAGERTRGVVEDVAARLDVPRRRVYDLALAWRDGTPGS